MKIRFGAAILVIIFLYSLHFVEAQPTKRVFRVGLLSGLRATPVPATADALRQGLKELGYIEGQNVLFEYRWAGGNDDRFTNLAAELASLNVDVILTQGARATIAAKQATETIPIVVGSAGDLVGEGIVNSLARPGGNVTGFTNIEPDLSAKRLELLKETLPKTTRVAVLYHGGPGGDQEELRETQKTAKKLAVRVQPLLVLEPNEFQAAYAAMAKERAQALIIFQTVFMSVYRKEVSSLRPRFAFQRCASHKHGLRSAVSFHTALICVINGGALLSTSTRFLREPSLLTCLFSNR